MADVTGMLMASAGNGGSVDPDFEYTTLLLHGDGTNGSQNNTFIDSSANNFTITRNGNTTQGTYSPFSKSDGKWGNYFDATDDYLIVADNAVLRPGAGAFTLEAWIFRAVADASHTIYAKGGASTGINFQVTSGNVLRFTHTTTNIDSSGTVSANVWVHVAVVREGTGTNQTKLYINGTQDGQGTVSTDFTQTEQVRIGTNRSAGDNFNGYISNVRFVKGSALYTGNFTPSTSPFTTTSQGATSSEVELLTCQSNRFVDNSSNGFALTLNGNPKVRPFSPFPLNTPYSPAVNGGAGYFDGTGDYLTASGATAAGSGSFCFEAWVYLTNSSANQMILGNPTSGGMWIGINIDSANKLAIGRVFTGIDNEVSFTWTNGQWYHIAVNRNGTSIQFFVNGVQIGSTGTNSVNYSTAGHTIGAEATGNAPFSGYISGWRFVNASVYTAAFTPPTAPPTAITNTTLLCNFTNAGILDNTCFNALETVGNAQIDTTTKKFGTGSLKFDGSGDYLRGIAVNANMNPQDGDFTVEFWVYIASLPGTEQAMVSTITNGGSGILVGLGSGANLNKIQFAIGNLLVSNPTVVDTSNFPTSQWVHVAAVRNSGTIYLYKNGTSVGTPISATAQIQQQEIYIGSWVGGNSPFNGYIDDLRISTIARYTTNFTPPNQAFPNRGP